MVEAAGIAVARSRRDETVEVVIGSKPVPIISDPN